jgi:hypothetical protein
MTRRQQVLRLFLLAGLAAMAGAWLILPPAPSAPDTSQPAPAAPADPANPAPTSPEGGAAAMNLPPLPPREARVPDVLPALQARADAGDGVAACRLSVELMRCQLVGRKFSDRQASLEYQLAKHRAQPAPRAVAATEAALATLRAEKASCDLLPEGLADRAQHYLRAAALAGEPMSRLRYAAGSGFDDTNSFDYLVTPAFDQWRREAEALMQQSLAAGTPAAVLVLADAYSGDQGLFAGLVANDEFQTQAYSRLLQRVFGDSLATFPFPLPQPSADVPDAARAEALATQWHQDHFGGRQHDLMELMVTQSSAPWSGSAAAAAADDPCPGVEGSTDG